MSSEFQQGYEPGYDIITMSSEFQQGYEPGYDIIMMSSEFQQGGYYYISYLFQ